MAVYVLVACCAIGVVAIAARFVKGADDTDPGGPTTGHAGAMISALFLLAFAIAIVVPWTTADAARLNTYAESQAVAEAYWAAAELPAPVAAQTQTALRDYVHLVRGPEWRLMAADGKLSSDGWTRLEGLRREVTALPARTDDAKDVRTAVLEHLKEISSARRQRAMDAATTPPGGLLVITVLTGIGVLLLPFLAGSRPRGLTLVPLALMAGLLAAGTYLTVDVSHVFDGALAVEPDAFTSLLAELQRINGAL